MAENFVEELLVGLGFKFDGEDGERFKKQTEVVSSAINKISTAAALATTALLAMSKITAEQTDGWGKASTVIDTSVESVARWRHAFTLAGIEGSKAVDVLTNLKTTAQETARTGAGPFQAYAELGVDFQSLASGALDVSDALEMILDNARNMDRTRAQVSLRQLGIDPLLMETSAEQLAAAFEEADKYSGITSQLAGKSAEFNDEWARTVQLLDGFKNDVANDLLPVLTEFLTELNSGLREFKSDGLPAIQEGIDALGGWAPLLLGLTATTALGPVLSGFSKLLKLVTGVRLAMAGTVAGAGLTAGALAPVLGVTAAGAGGVAAGTALQKELPEEASDYIGSIVAQTLAALGNERAQETLAFREELRNIERADRLRTIAGEFNPADIVTLTQDQPPEFPEIPDFTPADIAETPAPVMPDFSGLQIPNAGMLTLMAPEMPTIAAGVGPGSAAMPVMPPITITPPAAQQEQPQRPTGGNIGADRHPRPVRSNNQRTLNLTFNGLRQHEMEQMLEKYEREQVEYMDDETNDAIIG